MPTSKDIEKYPPQFHRLAARFETDTSPFEYGYATAGPAHKLRLRLYGFKEAVKIQNRAAETTANDMNSLPGGDPLMAQRLYPNFLATELIVKNEAGIWKVIVRMPEDDVDLEGLDEALATPSSNARAPVMPPMMALVQSPPEDVAEQQMEELLGMRVKAEPIPPPIASCLHNWAFFPHLALKRCQLCNDEQPLEAKD